MIMELAENVIEACALEFVRPPDKVPVSHWAAKHFHVDKTPPAPGLYDPTTPPWLNAIPDEYPDPASTLVIRRRPERSDAASI